MMGFVSHKHCTLLFGRCCTIIFHHDLIEALYFSLKVIACQIFDFTFPVTNDYYHLCDCTKRKYELEVHKCSCLKKSCILGKYFISSPLATRCQGCTVPGTVQLLYSCPKVREKFKVRKCFIKSSVI